MLDRQRKKLVKNIFLFLFQSAESPSELPEPKLNVSHIETQNLPSYSDIVEPLKQEINTLKTQLFDAQAQLAQLSLKKVEEAVEKDNTLNIDSPESHIEIDCEQHQICQHQTKPDIKYSNIVPIHRASSKNNTLESAPVAKVAERIKLRRAADGHQEVSPNELVNSEISTAVAEHIVGDILRQCDSQSERQAIDIEFRRLNAKLEHARSQNSVLALNLSETKAHCDR